MDTRLRTALVVLAATLAGAAVAARAEPTLRYNYDYVCNHERVVVDRCRHDSDMPGYAPTAPEDDYCQAFYPDRPKSGGLWAMDLVLRDDLIKTLRACGAFGATTSGSSAKQDTAANTAPPPVRPPDASAVAAPGIGAAHWRNLAFFDDIAYFVLPTNLQPGRRTGSGWFLSMYRDPKRSPDGRISQVAIEQEYWTADCARNTIAWTQSSYFSAAGNPLGTYVAPSPKSESVNSSGTTLAAGIFSLLCARHYELDDVDYSADAATIRKIWLNAEARKPSPPAQTSDRG